jgi:hypothetical protein
MKMDEKEGCFKVFSWRRDDVITIAATAIPNLIVWLLLPLLGASSSIISHSDSLHHIYAAKTLYRLHPFRSSACETRYNTSSVLSLPSGLPLLLRLVCLGSWHRTAAVISLSTSIAAALLFKRLLSSGKVCQPLFGSSLLSVFPFRYLSHRVVLSPDALYLSCAFLSFLAYTQMRMRELFWSVAAAAFISEQSAVLVLAFMRFGDSEKAAKCSSRSQSALRRR